MAAEGRRRFLLAAVPGLAAAWAWPARAQALASPPPSGPCAAAPGRIAIAGLGEPGQRLRVRGQVFRPDGRTPAAGVTVYAYQTDLTGRYAPPPGPPRLRGWMTTDAEGRFEYLTIRPAPYPGWTTPAHIHHQLWGGGAAPQYNEDILFDDDPLVGAADRRRSEERGRFGSVRRPVRGADGVLEVVHDMRLKAAADAFEDNIRHGLEACGLA